MHLLRRLTTRTNGPDVFDTSYTILLLEGLDCLEGLRPDLKHSLGDDVQRCQGSETGLFVDPRAATPITPASGHHAHQATRVAIESLDALGLRPPHALPSLPELADEQVLDAWLSTVDWSNPRSQAEEVAFRLSLLVFAAEVSRAELAPPLLHAALDWLNRTQDTLTGLWGTRQDAATEDALVAAYHLLPFYEYVHRPVPRMGRLADSVLDFLEIDGLFDGDPDVLLAPVGLLATLTRHTGYRGDEIKRELLKRYETALSTLCAQADLDLGGDGVRETWRALLILAIISATYPDELGQWRRWRFRRWPGPGYHRATHALSEHDHAVFRTWLPPATHAVPERLPDEVPAISVVIPCFNLGRYLCEAVESVLGQTQQSFEVIVVDDGSTDEYTRTLLRELERPRTRVIHQDNAGVAAARNRGIREAQGQYVCCLDADDRFRPSYFAEALPVLSSQAEVGFVTTNFLVFEDIDYLVEHDGPRLPEILVERDSCRLPEILIDNRAMQASLFKRSAWEQVGGYCETFSVPGIEDWDLWLRMLEAGYQAAVIPEVLFEYRARAQSMSTTMFRTENLSRMLDEFVERHRSSYETHVKDVYVCSRVLSFELRGCGERAFRALERARVESDVWRARYEEEAAKLRTANARLARIDESAAGRLYRRAKVWPVLRPLAERLMRRPPRDDER